MASIVVVQRVGGDAGVRECRDRGCAALRDRNGGDCRQISYRRNRASAEEENRLATMCARVVDIPQIVVDTPLADAPFPGFSSQRRAPDDELADFAAVFRNRVRVRAKASAPAPAGRERGGSRLVGGRFSFFGRRRGRLAADRRNVVSACRTASRTIGKTPRPTLRAGEHAWNSTGAQAGKYGIPTSIPPSTWCSPSPQPIWRTWPRFSEIRLEHRREPRQQLLSPAWRRKRGSHECRATSS